MIYYITSDEDNIFGTLIHGDSAAYTGTNYELALQAANSEHPYIWTVRVNRREKVEIIKRVTEVEEL